MRWSSKLPYLFLRSIAPSRHICGIVTGLLPAEPPKRIFWIWGRHGGPILVLRANHSATGGVPWVWNDQTGNTNRLPIRRVDSPYICHRPAASRASKTHFSGLGPPWRSHPCIEGYPRCYRGRAMGMERSDRQHQPIADTQSRFTVYVTGLLLPEPPKRIFRVWGSIYLVCYWTRMHSESSHKL